MIRLHLDFQLSFPIGVFHLEGTLVNLTTYLGVYVYRFDKPHSFAYTFSFSFYLNSACPEPEVVVCHLLS